MKKKTAKKQTMKKIDRLCPHSESKSTDAADYMKVGGIEYFRFSGKVDYIHLFDESALCEKPCLSHNYAALKPNGIVCPECQAKAMEISRLVKAAKKAAVA
jgi:hypothetical protein